MNLPLDRALEEFDLCRRDVVCGVAQGPDAPHILVGGCLLPAPAKLPGAAVFCVRGRPKTAAWFVRHLRTGVVLCLRVNASVYRLCVLAGRRACLGESPIDLF
jgi:hypothetical protein